ALTMPDERAPPLFRSTAPNRQSNSRRLPRTTVRWSVCCLQPASTISLIEQRVGSLFLYLFGRLQYVRLSLDDLLELVDHVDEALPLRHLGQDAFHGLNGFLSNGLGGRAAIFAGFSLLRENVDRRAPACQQAAVQIAERSDNSGLENLSRLWASQI